MLSLDQISSIGRTYRHMNRYRQILAVFIKFGFDDLINTLKVKKHLKIKLKLFTRKERGQVKSLSRAERLRMCLEELGPTFIKMGQILSTRPDLIPAELVVEFSKLQDQAPQFAYNEAKEIIENELARPLEELFADVEEVPVAAASLGQVHKAHMHNGKKVAIKVQRPSIRETIKIDLEIMYHLASLMERHLEEAEFYQPSKIIKEFTHIIEKELDYTIEAFNMGRFAEQFSSDERIYVPKVYRELTTERILTMEYVEGIKVSDRQGLHLKGLDPKEIADKGADLMLSQVFDHKFFHADPHPGNIIILSDNIICYLDYGMMGRITSQNKDDFADLVVGIVAQDQSRAAKALLKLTTWDEEPERQLLNADLNTLTERFLYRSLREINFSKIVQQLLEIASSHRLRLQSDMFLMLKVLATVDGLSRELDPEFDITTKVKEFITRIQRERFDPRRMSEEAAASTGEYFTLLRVIPGELKEILRKIRQGRVKMEFEHRGLEPMLSTFDKISNRIAFAIVLASMVVGSSLIVLAGVPPRWYGIPMIGLAGFVIAGIMAFWLLWSILRRGRL